jgi:hypothetical protein
MPRSGKKRGGHFSASPKGKKKKTKRKYNEYEAEGGGLAQVGGKTDTASTVQFSPHLRQAAGSLTIGGF